MTRGLQDLVARFTLDSATEFLFDSDAHSLDASLPYPQGSPLAKASSPSFANHPSNVFVQAFARSQTTTAKRTAIGSTWQLLEFWNDTVAADRGTLDQFVQPLLDKALMEKERRTTNPKDSMETLLDFLVDKTSGTCLRIRRQSLFYDVADHFEKIRMSSKMRCACVVLSLNSLLIYYSW
jgi:hypothetical protein